MKENCITEIVTFQMDPTMNDDEVIRMVEKLEVDFHMSLDGYIDSELSKGSDKRWLLTMHWESLYQLKRASNLMLIDPRTEVFRKVVIPPSVKIALYEKVKSWKTA